MKRFNLIFAVVVVTAFVSAFIVERSRSRNVSLPDYAVPPKEVLDPLEAPRGEHTLTGTIVAHTGHPAAGVFVHLRLVEGDLVADPMFFEHTDGDGRFELAHLPAGRYEVVLLSTGVPNTQWDDFTMPLSGAAEGGVRWTLPEPYSELPVLPEIVRADLVGVLVLPEAIAADDWSLEGYEVVLSPREGVDPWSGAFERRTATDVNGGFRIEELVVSKYVIRVLPPWAWGSSWPFLSDVKYASEEVAMANGPLAVALDCGEVTGALVDRDGRPIEGALVRVFEQDRPEFFWRVRGTDGDGGFRVRDLPPGRYVVRVDTGGVVREVEVEVESGQRSEATFPPIDHRDPRDPRR